MTTIAPVLKDVNTIAHKYLNNINSIERVLKGSSTYVYRVISNNKIYYMRFLPENGSFASEVLTHNILYSAGIKVPQVIGFEHKNDLTGLSLMLLNELPGICIEDEQPCSNIKVILRDAGRQLALIHSVPVDGFGWIDKNSYNKLKGEKNSFNEYFLEFLNSDLYSLNQYPFSKKDQIRITNLMEKARHILNVINAVLVHGDFDISHIFYSVDKYTGIIDFGEIRGNNRLYDLATFVGFYQDRLLYSYLLEGYNEISTLTEEDIYATELMALFIILRLVGKKVNTNSGNYWCQLLKKQLDYINSIS